MLLANELSGPLYSTRQQTGRGSGYYCQTAPRGDGVVVCGVGDHKILAFGESIGEVVAGTALFRDCADDEHRWRDFGQF